MDQAGKLLVVDAVGQVPASHTRAIAQANEASHCSPFFCLGRANALFVMWKVGKSDVKMLIDTGAAVTLVHKKALNGKGMPLKLKLVPTLVRTSCGERLTMDGQCTTVCTLQHGRKRCTSHRDCTRLSVGGRLPIETKSVIELSCT